MRPNKADLNESKGTLDEKKQQLNGQVSQIQGQIEDIDALQKQYEANKAEIDQDDGADTERNQRPSMPPMSPRANIPAVS